MSKQLAFVLACATALLPLTANALGLGEIKLNSGLNQNLNADVTIVGATPGELDSLKVTLASQQQFQQAGLDRPDALSQLQFQVVKNPDGSASVHITSLQAVREPFLDFLVDATWDNGELLREYTVFLNPPNFETPAPAVLPAPVQAQPAPVAAPAAPAIPAPATTTAAVIAAPAPATVPAPATAIAATAATAATAEVTAPPALGSNYGPIHRGETLSEIALRMRPKGVTLNQMMIAIYRANHEVFMHNINRMKAGYVMRIPSMADIQAVNIKDANSEVRAQIEEWRSNRGQGSAKPSSVPQPPLQLVAPSSAAETTANQLPGAGKGGTGASSTVKTPAQPAASAAPVAAATSSQAPIAVKNSGLAAVQNQAGNASKSVAQPAAAGKPKPPAPTASSGLLDTLQSPYVLGIAAVVLIIVLIGVLIKKRKSTSSVPTPKRIKVKATAAGADWQEQERAGLKDESDTPVTRTRGKAAADDAMSRSTVTMKSLMPTAPTADRRADVAKLDESDPVAEADFHMAYGLYDQAAEVLKKTLQQDPGRRDLKMKLLEVFFTAGNRASFVDTARGLRQEMGASPDKDWESIAIMGRQVAPDESLFAATGTASATDSSVDIALDSSGTSTLVTDADPLAGAFAGITAPAGTKAAPAAATDHSLDFIPTGAKSTTGKAQQESKAAEGGMDFDLGDFDIEPGGGAKPAAKPDEPTITTDFGTDSQVEFDKALKELADFVNTNVPPQEDASKSAPEAGMSLAAEPPAAAAGAGDDATGGLNEIGTKLDLARAYIDMGDADGAKNILEEVLQEGDAQQKKEARELMKHLA